MRQLALPARAMQPLGLSRDSCDRQKFITLSVRRQRCRPKGMTLVTSVASPSSVLRLPRKGAEALRCDRFRCSTRNQEFVVKMARARDSVAREKGSVALIAPTLSREEALRRLDVARAAYVASGEPLLSEEDISVLLDRDRFHEHDDAK